MGRKTEAARQERQQLQAKKVAEKLSTARKRPSKQTGSASSRSKWSGNRQSEQASTPQSVHHRQGASDTRKKCRPHRQRKQSLEDVSVQLSQLAENQSEEDTGSELDDTRVVTPAAVACGPVVERVWSLEERNVDKQQQKRKPKPPICRKLLNCIDMAFTETQDEEDIVTLPMQTVDGDEIEVEFSRHLSACPKKTLSGSDAVKGDPVILAPMFEDDSCIFGCIIINPKGAKPQEVATGGFLVFLLMSGRVRVEIQCIDLNYVQQIKPGTMFVIPKDVTYSIRNIEKLPAELVFVGLKNH